MPVPKAPHGDSFTQLDEKKHTYRRRMIQGIFSMTSVLESEKYIDNCTASFLEVLSEYAEKDEIIDLGEWMNMYAFDVIGELFFGRPFGFIKERTDFCGYLSAVDNLLPHSIRMGVLYAWMRPIQFLMVPFSSSLQAGIRVFNKLKGSSWQLVEERVGKKSARTDMLAKLLQVAEEKGPDFDLTDVHTEAYTAM
jgi:cytochrome P450